MNLRFGFLIIAFSLSLLSLSVTAQSPGQLKEVYSGGTVHFANNLEFSKDGNYMVLVVGFNADVFQKNESGFGFLQTIKGGKWQAYNPGISNDGTFICFSNYEDTYVYKRTGESYSMFQTIRHPGKSENKDLIMRFDGNEKLMIIGGEGNIRFYELRESGFVEIKRVMNGGNVFQNAALSANGKLMATIDGNGDLQCWQLTANDAVPGSIILKTNKYIGVLDITDDLLLASGTTDSLNLYTVSKDLNSATKVYQFPASKFSEVKFNPDGNRIIIANNNSKLETYRIAGNSLTLEYVNSIDKDNFTSIKMSEDGKWMAASSSGAKTLKIYEAPAPIAKPKTSAANAKAGTKPDDKKVKPLPATATAKTVSAPKVGPTVIVSKKANGRFILVDSVSLKPVSEAEYDEAGKLKTGGFYLYKKKHYGLARKDGQVFLNPDTSKYRYIKDELDSLGNRIGVLYDPNDRNQMGEYVLLNKQYVQIASRSYSIILNPEDGIYKSVMTVSSDDQNYGLLFRNGKEMLKPVYRAISLKKKDKLIFVYTTDDKEGLYDYTGKTIVPDGFEIRTFDLEEKKFIEISKGGLTGLIDKKGKTIVPLKYSSITYMDYGVNSYYSVILKGKEGIMNTAFKEIIKPEYKNLFPEFENGCSFYSASKDGINWGWVDKTGKILLPLIYKDLVSCPGKEPLSKAILSDTSSVYVNKLGHVVLAKKYKDAFEFTSGIACVKEKEKYGFINTKGAYIIQPSIDKVSFLYDNSVKANHMYAVEKDGKCGFMNKSANLVIPYAYDTLGLEEYYSISEELISVKQNKKWGFIDMTGKQVIPFNYDYVSSFSEGVAEVTLNGETFNVDKKGTRVK